MRWRDYQSGLRFEDGRPKPARASFALGLVAHRDARRGGVRLLGPRAAGLAAGAQARISVREPDGRWRTLARARTRADGTFELAVAVDPGRTFRLESGRRRGAPVEGAR